jgi:hypothetical protein
MAKVQSKLSGEGINLSPEFCALVKVSLFNEFRFDQGIRRMLDEDGPDWLDWEGLVEARIQSFRPLRCWLPPRAE